MSVIGKEFDLILMKGDIESGDSFWISILSDSYILPNMEIKVSLLYIHVQSGLIEIFRQTESNFLFNCLMSNIMSPIIDLDRTAVSKVDEVDLKLVQVVLDKDKTIDLFAT